MGVEHLMKFAERARACETIEDLAVALRTWLHEPHKPWGLETDAETFAEVLWETRRLAQTNVRTVLHVGTGFGFEFFAFLVMLQNPHVTVSTTDSKNFIITDVCPFVRMHRHIVPFEAFHDRTFDMVIVDGKHADIDHVFDKVGKRARACVFLHGEPERTPTKRIGIDCAVYNAQ